MNTRRVSVLIIGVCVAALSACDSSAQSPNQSAVNTPSITDTTPSGYDRWQEMDGGSADIPEMTIMAERFGLNEIRLPTQEYFDQDVIGVSVLERYCVLAFSSNTALANKGLTDVTLMSRYNKGYIVIMPAIPSRKMAGMIDKYRPFCDGEAELPVSTEPPAQTA